MNEPELLTRQRQALRAFRRTVTATSQEGQKATERVETVAVGARDEAQAQTSQARNWLGEANDALTAARETLAAVNLASLLDRWTAAPNLGPGASAGAELERSAASASRTAASLEPSVQALQEWREARARLKRRLVVMAFVALLACVVAAIVGGYQYSLARRYARAVSALEAGQWEVAREEFIALASYRDARIMVTVAENNLATSPPPATTPASTETTMPTITPASTKTTMSTTTSVSTKTIMPTATRADTKTPVPTASHAPKPTMSDVPQPTLTRISTPRPSPSFTPMQASELGYRIVSLGKFANASLDFESPPMGNIVLGGVPFELSRKVFKSQASPPPHSRYPTSILVPANVPQAYRVHLLLNAGNGFSRFRGKAICRVIAYCNNVSVPVADLKLGRDIREWHADDKTVVSMAPRVQRVWSGKRSDASSLTGYIDLLSLDLPKACRSGRLTALEVLDISTITVDSLDPAINLVGITVEYHR